VVDINVIKNSFTSTLNGAGLLEKDAVNVFINGVSYQPWQSLSISRDLDSPIGTFTMEFVDKWRQAGDEWPLKPGAAVSVKIGTRKQPVITGYIDKIDASISKDDRSVTITGRDLTSDLVDCSYIEENEIESTTFLALANKLASFFGLTATYENPALASSDKPFKFRYQQGDTMMEILAKEGKPKGFNLKTDGEGNLVIFNRNNSFQLPTSPVALEQDGNILTASIEIDHSERFSTYIVKGQASNDDLGWGLIKNQAKGVADDTGIGRTRAKIILSDAEVDNVSVQTQAEQEADIRKRQSNKVSITVQGWTKGALGELWEVGDLVPVNAGFIGVSNATMLIKSVSFEKSVDSGTLTTLGLVTPDSFRVEKTKSKDINDDLGWKRKTLTREQALELSPKL